MELGPSLSALLVFILTYALIFSERVHRAIVALAGAVAMLLVGWIFGFYSWEEAIGAIDFNSLALLFGMMIVVGLLRQTGFFQYLAIHTARFTQGRPMFLLLALSGLAALVSTLLDNVTTVLAIAPVTLSVTEILNLDPAPFLLAEAVLSNVGGVATLVGDPPNILIGSAAGFSFTDFLVYLAPLVLVIGVVVDLSFRLFFRRDLAQGSADPELLRQLNPQEAITNHRQLRVILAVFVLVVLLYLVHDRLGLKPGFVALIGAALSLLFVRPKIEEALASVEWDALIFLSGLFIVIHGLEAAGVLGWLATQLSGLTRYGEVILALAILWMSTIFASFGGAIPAVLAFIPLVRQLAGQISPSVWWALALGAGLGGNVTPMGTAAGVVISSFAERVNAPLTFRYWVKRGTPIAFISLVLASLLLWMSMAVGWIK